MFYEETADQPGDQIRYIQENQSEFFSKSEVPKQLDRGMVKATESVQDAGSNIMKALMGSNIIISFLAAYMLQYLWGLINAL